MAKHHREVAKKLKDDKEKQLEQVQRLTVVRQRAAAQEKEQVGAAAIAAISTTPGTCTVPNNISHVNCNKHCSLPVTLPVLFTNRSMQTLFSVECFQIRSVCKAGSTLV